MGMDVYGLKPKTEKGEYFRNNVWYWHPLWDFCDEVAADLIEDVEGDGHTNSGFVVPDFNALDLGTRLKNALDEGVVTQIGAVHGGKGRPKLAFAMSPVTEAAITAARSAGVVLVDKYNTVNVLDVKAETDTSEHETVTESKTNEVVA